MDDRPLFGVWQGDVMVATSMLHLDDGVAGVYCVSTRAGARGRGLGAHATAEPLRLAQRLGYRVGVLQSSEEGRSVYERLGFQTYGAVPLFVRTPAQRRT